MPPNQSDRHRKAKKFVAARCGPNLKVQDVDWDQASSATKRYNCVGFALGELKWWEPPKVSGGMRKNPHQFWPQGIAEDDTEALVESYVEAAKSIGFSACISADPEEGLEKITLYYAVADKKRLFMHAVLHLPDGKCASKLGPDSDIEHPRDAFDGASCCYGDGRIHMSRPASMRTIPRSLIRNLT
jgi:hypothetical protein